MIIIGFIVKHFYFFKSFFFVDFLQSHLYNRYNSNVSPNFHKIQYVSFIFTKLSSKSAMTNDQFNTSIKKRYFEANYTQTMPFLFFCSINHYKYTRVVELCWKWFYGKKKESTIGKLWVTDFSHNNCFQKNYLKTDWNRSHHRWVAKQLSSILLLFQMIKVQKVFSQLDQRVQNGLIRIYVSLHSEISLLINQCIAVTFKMSFIFWLNYASTIFYS